MPRGTGLVLLTLAVLALAVPLAAASPGAAPPPPADTTAERPPVTWSIRPIPASFYSASKGIGVGAAVTFQNVGWTGSEIEVSAEPMTRFGRYGAALATANPFEARRYGLVGITYTTASRHPYFGIGPATRRDDEVRTSFERIQTEVRFGFYPEASRTLVLQPVARLQYGRVRGFEEHREGALERLDPNSRENLFRTAEAPTLGLTYGLEAVLDFTDDPEYATRGGHVQASLRRYDGLRERPARFWTATGGLYGALPLGRPTRVLEGRAVAAVTRSLADEPIPFYELPALDAQLLGGYTPGRLVGPDVLAFSGGVRFRLLNVLGLVAGDAFVGLHAANAYTNVFEEASLRVSLARDPEVRDGRAPLRPALGVGGYLVGLRSGRPVLSGQIGITPEGIELGTLRFLYDLRARPYGVR